MAAADGKNLKGRGHARAKRLTAFLVHAHAADRADAGWLRPSHCRAESKASGSSRRCGRCYQAHASGRTARRRTPREWRRSRRRSNPPSCRRAKNLSLCGCVRRSVRGPPGALPFPYAARYCSGRSLSVHSGRRKTGDERQRQGVQRSLPLLTYTAPGALWQDPGRATESPAEAEICGNHGFAKEGAFVDVGPADVEPPLELAVRLRALGAQVRACAPPDCAEQLAETMGDS
jgi:hypothetical protein